MKLFDHQKQSLEKTKGQNKVAYEHQKKALKLSEGMNKVAVPGYEGLYEIDEQGNVYSVLKQKRQIKVYPNSAGYLRVNLYKNGCYKKYFIHRLVAKIFIPNPNDLPVVNHKDANKNNNSVENLEWCTQSYNVAETYNNGRAKSTRVFIDDKEFRSLIQGSLFLGKYNNYLCAKAKQLGNNFMIDGHKVIIKEVI